MVTIRLGLAVGLVLALAGCTSYDSDQNRVIGGIATSPNVFWYPPPPGFGYPYLKGYPYPGYQY